MNNTDTLIKNSVLKDLGVNLNERAREGKLDKVLGREFETNRLVQILSRRKKNNGLLIGEPGVGKTAIAENLAIKMESGDISYNIKDKIIFSLDIGSLMAGTQYRGQMEQRIKDVIDFLKENKNIILFIDEIHTILDTGGSSNSLNIANILKPPLANGEIQCIGATTLEEAKKYFEKDSALDRRFQKVLVEEMSIENTIKILQGCKDVYEDYHGIVYSHEVLEQIPAMAKKYITNRFLPDSAIDILDETGAIAQMESSEMPKKILKLEEDLSKLNVKKRKYIKEEAYSKIPELKKTFQKIENVLSLEIDKVEEMKVHNRREINMQDVTRVVSSLSRVPLDEMADNPKLKLDSLKEELDNNLIGQNDAKTKVINSLKRNVVGINNGNKPIASFLFLGKTGTGKTELAKLLSNKWFNGKMIRFDMSEFMEKHNSSQLVGAPPGYVGHDDGGQLTERVKREPYSLILLDEIEKAHPDILNILLQILDDGHATDSRGNRIDFTNTIVIMTSNLGARQSAIKGVGFNNLNEDSKKSKLVSTSIESAKKHFKPEIWNRIDEVVVFDEVTQDIIDKVVDINLSKFKTLLKAKNIKMRISSKVKKFLAEKGYSDEYGVRFLERTVKDLLIDKVVDFLIENENDENIKISASIKDDEIVIKEV